MSPLSRLDSKMGCEGPQEPIPVKSTAKDEQLAKGSSEGVGPAVKSSHPTHQQQVSEMVQSLNELLAVLFYVSIVGTLIPSGVFLVLLAWNWVFFRYLLVLYLGWMYVIDSQSAYNGGWKFNAFEKYFRSLTLWDYYKGYFNAKLIKEEELDQSKNYILCCHPHVTKILRFADSDSICSIQGVYCLSAFGNLYVHGSSKPAFEGFRVRVSTLPINFYMPLWRELLLALGTTTCDKKSLLNVLKEPKTCLVLAVGGAEEFEYMEPHTMDLVMDKRKGFCKLALESGASLVPIIGFGENELFERIQNPFVEKVNEFTRQVGHFAAPFFKGRFGLWIPHRSQLVSIGKSFA